jgi:hypothetical protein
MMETNAPALAMIPRRAERRNAGMVQEQVTTQRGPGSSLRGTDCRSLRERKSYRGAKDYKLASVHATRETRNLNHAETPACSTPR